MAPTAKKQDLRPSLDVSGEHMLLRRAVRELPHLQGGEAYWISEGVTRMSCDAMHQLPRLHFDLDAAPQRHGVVLFERPVKIPMRAGCNPRTGETSYRTAYIRRIHWSIRDGWCRVQPWETNHGRPTRGAPPWEKSIPPGAQEIANQSAAFRLLFTLWCLLDQHDVCRVRTEAGLSRGTTGESQRRQPDGLRAVTLRPDTDHALAYGSSPSRQYNHRFPVRGHWREITMGLDERADRMVSRRTWVSPHMKGPEDGPLLDLKTVYAVRVARGGPGS